MACREEVSDEARSVQCSSPLGLVAGNGQFPMQLVREVHARGRSVVAAMHRGEADPALKDMVEASIPIGVGQIGKILRFFLKQKVSEVVFLGGIRRSTLLRYFRPDFLGMKVLARVQSVEDDRILRGVAEEFEKHGLQVVDPANFLQDYVVRTGQFSSRELTKKEHQDAVIGWKAAKGLGAIDVGQTVVVAQGMVIAIEAIEGTDATIERAGQLNGRKGAVVVKLPKPQQDRRIDLPAVGPKTLESMANAGCSALVLESEGALLLEPEKVCRLADKHEISIVAFDSFEALERAQ